MRVNRLEVRSVNGIDLKAFDASVVKKGSYGTVYGTKVFPEGLTVDNLCFRGMNLNI